MYLYPDLRADYQTETIYNKRSRTQNIDFFPRGIETVKSITIIINGVLNIFRIKENWASPFCFTCITN